MDFRVLGSVEVLAGDQPLELGPPRQRLVVAALAVDAGRVVTAETLIDRVWDAAPAGARRSLHVYITRVRRVLADATDEAPSRLLRRSGGYLLDVEPDQVDAHRFRRLVEQARDPDRALRERAALLREAVALWRGQPLSNLPGEWAARIREAWWQEYLNAMVARAHTEIDTGDPGSVIGPLTVLAGESPLVEPLAAALMRAMAASGRSGEALGWYQRTRQALVEELGVDPGPELQAVHQAILRGEPTGSTDAYAVPCPSPTSVRVAPAQLPADVPGFTGRAEQLAQLDALLAKDDSDSATVVVSAVLGTGGVGKTALAIHWAHRIRERFPDGQLYVNLRGFDAGGSVLDPAEAMRGFLDALGVAPPHLPVQFAAQAALYRSLLAGRRMLIVLDNARDSEQVRPLLPGAAGCFVLVTSRTQLTSLVAVEGAHPVTVDLLSTDEARELLARRVGADRTAAEPQAVAEIIARCSRLPIALAIAAARAAIHPTFPLTLFAQQLRSSHDQLAALAGEDPTTDVRAVFSWSFKTLTPGAARLFRLLGSHPSPDLTGPAAASLTGLPPRRALSLVVELACAHLIIEHAPGRYTCHDLLRAYAMELAHHSESAPERHAAAHRVIDHYLHSAYTAACLHDPLRERITMSPPQPGVTPEAPATYTEALRWFTAEQHVLLATTRHAAATGFTAHTWRLAWTLLTFLDGQGQWHDLTRILTAALHAANELADRAAQAQTHRGLGLVHTRLGELDTAHRHLHHALELTADLNDHTGHANTLLDLAYLRERQTRFRDALQHSRQALDLYRAAGHQTGIPAALNNIGYFHALLGDHPTAITHARQALTRYRRLDNLRGQAESWHCLGYAYKHLRDFPRAITCYEHALTLFQHLNDHYPQAIAATRLGETHQAAGNPHAAQAAWNHALTILDTISPTDANHIREAIRSLRTTFWGGQPSSTLTISDRPRLFIDPQ